MSSLLAFGSDVSKNQVETVVLTACLAAKWSKYLGPDVEGVAQVVQSLDSLSRYFALPNAFNSFGELSHCCYKVLSAPSSLALRDVSVSTAAFISNTCKAARWLHSMKAVNLVTNLGRIFYVGQACGAYYHILAAYDSYEAYTQSDEAAAFHAAKIAQHCAETAMALIACTVAIHPITALMIMTISTGGKVAAEYQCYVIETVQEPRATGSYWPRKNSPRKKNNELRLQSLGVVTHLCSYTKKRPQFFFYSLRNASQWCSDLTIVPKHLSGVIDLCAFAKNVRAVQGGFTISSLFAAKHGWSWYVAVPKIVRESAGLLMWLEKIHAITLARHMPHVQAARIYFTAHIALAEWWETPRPQSLSNLFTEWIQKKHHNAFFLGLTNRVYTVALLLLNAALFMEASPFLLLQVGSVVNVSHCIAYILKERAQEMLSHER